MILPEGFEESTPVYDTDDELVSTSDSLGGSGGLTRQLTLDVRGEILADINQIATYSANGALMGDGNYQSGGAYNTEAPNGLQSDMRTGMITAITNGIGRPVSALGRTSTPTMVLGARKRNGLPRLAESEEPETRPRLFNDLRRRKSYPHNRQ